jgi:hypothetical protein
MILGFTSLIIAISGRKKVRNYAGENGVILQLEMVV